MPTSPSNQALAFGQRWGLAAGGRRYFCAWWFFFVLINPGDLGSVDTSRRLQVAHSWWTAAPEVAPDDWPEFGIQACGNTIRAWYGAGQSALMLPADIVASQITSDAQLRAAVVALLVFPALSVLTLVFAEALLRAFALSPPQARIAVAIFAIATSFLPYAQINQENSLMFFLLLASAVAALRYAETGSRAAVAAAAGISGLGINTRLPGLADVVLVITLALFLRVLRMRRSGPFHWRAIRLDAAVCAAITLAAVGLERVYYHSRFCDWTGTYISKFAQTLAMRDPVLPAGFPFSNPFWSGIAGFLWSKDFSIFLTDPVLILALGLAAATWRSWKRRERAVFAMAGVLLGILVIFYAGYYDWWGGSSWGSRFTTAPAQLMCLVVIGLVVRSWKGWTPMWRVISATLIAAGVAANLLAVVFWYELEIQQQFAGVSTQPVLVMRAVNVAALLTNHWDGWGLHASTVSERLMRPNALAWLAQPRLGPAGHLVLALWGGGLPYRLQLSSGRFDRRERPRIGQIESRH